MCDLLTRQDSGLRFGSSTVETARRSVSILDRGILLSDTHYHHGWLSNIVNDNAARPLMDAGGAGSPLSITEAHN